MLRGAREEFDVAAARRIFNDMVAAKAAGVAEG